MKRPLLSITPAAMICLENYHWPGNVRELENVIERTVTLTEGSAIGRSDLPTNISGSCREDEEPQISCPRLTEAGLDMPQIIEGIERCMIKAAMELSGGVKARAAELLNIKRTTLVEKIKRLSL